MIATVISKVLSMKSATVLVVTLAASALDALPAVAGPERLERVLVSEVSRPPAGWVEFCTRQPGECAGTARHCSLTGGVEGASTTLADFERHGIPKSLFL